MSTTTTTSSRRKSSRLRQQDDNDNEDQKTPASITAPKNKKVKKTVTNSDDEDDDDNNHDDEDDAAQQQPWYTVFTKGDEEYNHYMATEWGFEKVSKNIVCNYSNVSSCMFIHIHSHLFIYSDTFSSFSSHSIHFRKIYIIIKKER
jgi:hypothetical protein